MRKQERTIFFDNLIPVSLKPLLFFVMLFTGLQVFSQQLDSVLAIAETAFPQEKIYLQTDKNVYAGGETVWFKAYLTAQNAPVPYSKTVYAELITEKGSVIQRRTMPVILSGAEGDFTIPDSMADTRLYLRSYTAWMLNFDSSLLYVKPLYVIPKKITPPKKTSPLWSLAFFPEGGDMVINTESVIAYKATDQDGMPVAIKGDIVNNSNKKIASFAPAHDGMGSFVLTPLPGETYKAVWKDKTGKQKETPLPAAKKEGVVLHVNTGATEVAYTLTRTETASDAFKKFTVIAKSQNRIQYGAAINLSQKNTVTASFATDSIPDGILQITVFNAMTEPVAERILFVNNNNYSFITDLHMAEMNLDKRARNVVQIDVGGNINSNLSVSVTDAEINPPAKNEDNIYSSLLLSSDLKGYIYNPAYYFSSDDDSVKQHLDLVMMTNGWRRFSWQAMLAGQWPPVKYQPENYLSIQGKVVGLTRAQLYDRTLTGILKSKIRQPEYLSIPLNDKGEFALSGLNFYDTAKLYYQFSNDKDKDITHAASFLFTNSFIKAPQLTPGQVNNFYMPNKTDSSALAKNISNAILRAGEEKGFGKEQVLAEVRLLSKKKPVQQKLDEEYTSGFFSGGDNYSFAVEGDAIAESSSGILQYLQGKVAGLQISTNGGTGATWRGSNTSIFLNETQTDISALQSINMKDVALIKVFRPPFFGATGGGSGGAIAVYLKKGTNLNSGFTGLPSSSVYGYSVVRQFYSPDYSVKTNDASTPDRRTTLYWNAHVFFDYNSRRITLPFYNNDSCKKIRVIVEGINENGQLTREEKIF